MKIYSFLPISNQHSTVLVLGTMPGKKSLELNQYYGHNGNIFWKLIFAIFNEPFSTVYEIRKNILLKNNIALWDVLHFCERKGSSDNAIKEEKPNDFISFFENHPKVKLVVFNGQKAEAFFNKLCRFTTNVEFITFPSTSPANTWKTYDEKLYEWQKIKTK